MIGKTSGKRVTRVQWSLSSRAGGLPRKLRQARRTQFTSFSALIAVVLVGAGTMSASAIAVNSTASSRQDSSHVITTIQTGITTTKSAHSTYPDGTPDSNEPSGESPPGASAFSGYTESYVNDFTGTSLPSGWQAFTGVPNGDEGSLWEPTHVVVGSGELQLNAWQDPAHGNAWVTGGVSQSGVAHTYGAYFVRSRLTDVGATQVELLWPSGSEWPPEVDFNETRGGDTSTTATVHFTGGVGYETLNDTIDMTQWHTWGVVWTPTSITYTVDGEAWGQITTTSEIPTVPMNLDITQQTWCMWGWGCPTAPESTLVDWVAEYSPTGTTTTTSPPTTTTSTTSPPTTTTSPPTSPPVSRPPTTPPATTTTTTAGEKSTTAVVGPFAANSAKLSAKVKSKIDALAREIKARGDTKVLLVGYSDDLGGYARSLAISRSRAVAVEHYLLHRLRAMKLTGVTVFASGRGSADPIASNTKPAGQARNRRVVSLMLKTN